MSKATLIVDDCINIEDYITRKSGDVILTDPPYGTGQVHALGCYSYDDVLNGKGYIEYMTDRLAQIKTCMHNSALLVVHLDINNCYEIASVIQRKLGLYLNGDFVWAYRRWSSKKNSLQSNHDLISVFSSDQSLRMGRRILPVSIVAPSSCERVGYPTQKPMKLISRVLTELTTVCDVRRVIDPFCGSGSTLLAAARLGMDTIGMDRAVDAIDVCEERLRLEGFQPVRVMQNRLIESEKNHSARRIA